MVQPPFFHAVHNSYYCLLFLGNFSMLKTISLEICAQQRDRFDSIFHSRFLASHVLIGWRQFYLQFGSELEWKSRVHFRLTLLTDINYRSKNFAYWSHFSWHCQLADNSWALCEKLRDSVNNISSRLVNLSQSFWFIICLREKNSSSVKLNLKFDGNSFSHWSVVSRQRYNKMRRKY